MEELYNLNVSLKYLRQFFELSQFRSMGQYATQIGVSTQQVSNMVADLESKMGHTLLLRDKKNKEFELTLQGRELLKNIPAIFEEIKTIKNKLDEIGAYKSSHFDLYATEMLIANVIVPHMKGLEAAGSKVLLHLYPYESLPPLDIRKKFICICQEAEFHKDIVQVPLKKFHVKLWASQSYIDQYGAPQTIKDLKRHKLLCYTKKFDDSQYPTMNWYLKHYNLDVMNDNLVIVKMSSAITKAAQAGSGIFALSKENVELAKLDMVEILPDFPGPVVNLVLSYPKIFEKNPHFEDLRSHFIKVFSSMEWKASPSTD